MNQDKVCSINNDNQSEIKNCAVGLLQKALSRPKRDEDTNTDNPYTAEEIESVISDMYPIREIYMSKIAKIALHISAFTRTGRVSFTFQNQIFNRQKSGSLDYLKWLFGEASSANVFPELYKSQKYITDSERKKFETIMQIEHSALLEGLRYVSRKCCDENKCTPTDISKTYSDNLFESGTVFDAAAKSVCMTRKVKTWTPPPSDITIPDTTPISTRNYGINGQMICFNVNNLIHNLAVLEPGKRLQHPWGGELMTHDIMEDLIQKFDIEIKMRRWYLDQKSNN